MVDFVENIEVEQRPEDAFEIFFQKNIVPLVEYDNQIKRKYRGRFWAFLLAVMFFVCANALIALFNSLMHARPFNWLLLLFISACAFFVVFIPIFSYYRQPREDVFDVFLRFHGHWNHGQHKDVKLVHSPIIPPHEFVASSHAVESTFNGVDIEIRDTVYTNKFGLKSLDWRRTISKGVVLYLTLPTTSKETILLFDKNSFMRKAKFNNMPSLTGSINVMAANFFNIFCADVKYAQSFLRAAFFERILDMKDLFQAKSVCCEIKDNYMRIYFENSRFYVDSYKFWSRELNKDKFRQIDREFEGVFIFVDTVNYLLAELND